MMANILVALQQEAVYFQFPRGLYESAVKT